MKLVNLIVLALLCLLGNAQSLPLDFESQISTSDFVDFDGGIAMVIDNPQSNGINDSERVGQIIRNGGAVWAGSKIILDNNVDFSTMNSISMKVYSTAPVGTTVKFKLEGNGTTERDAQTTLSGEWEILTWDFTGEPTNFNEVVFMFDFGNVGDGSESSTFLFDDVEQLFGGYQIDLPVDFEQTDINYTTTDFGGNESFLEEDFSNSNNHIIKVIKTVDAATWAGTTIGTNAGFATNIPLSLTDSKMSIRVWSPDVGIPVRLKVEDSNDPTHTCETEKLTTTSEEWEIIEFDFLNQAPGTELLSVGLDMGWTYNMASIFFNFGAEGSVEGEKTYFFDDVQFGEFVVANSEIDLLNSLEILPNPTVNEWLIYSENYDIEMVRLFDLNGHLIHSWTPRSKSIEIDASQLQNGLYFVSILSNNKLTSRVLSRQ